MDKPDYHFSRGSILVFSTGEYSDYGIVGFLVAVKNLNLKKLVKQYQLEFVPVNDWDIARPEDFPSWLVSKELAMPIDNSKIRLGNYGDFEDDLLDD